MRIPFLLVLAAFVAQTPASSIAAPAAPAAPAAHAAPASYQVFAQPKEYPDDGPRTIEVDPAAAGGPASPFGWHDTNGAPGAEYTVTRGNNVHAYTDVDA